MNSTSTKEHKTEYKTEYNYTLMNQATNIRKSKKGVTKEIDQKCNNNRQKFKGRKTHDKNKQRIKLNYIKTHYTEQNRQLKYKGNIIKDKKQLNDNKHSIG